MLIHEREDAIYDLHKWEDYLEKLLKEKEKDEEEILLAKRTIIKIRFALDEPNNSFTMVNSDENIDDFIEENDLLDELSNFYSYDAIKELIVDCVEDDDMLIAAHILEIVKDGSFDDYYSYDISKGTLESPVKISNIKDLFDIYEDELEELDFKLESEE